MIRLEIDEPLYDEDGYEVSVGYLLELYKPDPQDWIFDRLVRAGETVMAEFHHVRDPGVPLCLTLRREEAEKLAKAILK